MNRLKSVFGSQRAIADALGVGESAVGMWRGRGIPDAQKWRLLEIARERGLKLAPEDLGMRAVEPTRSEKNRLANCSNVQ